MLHQAKECDQEWYTEVYYKTVEEGDDDEFLSGSMCNDR